MIAVASWLLIACGIALIGIGGFFVVVRAPLLPEDARFMDQTPVQILAAVPRLEAWLRRVFSVLGAFVATTGLLVVYVSATGVRDGDAVSVLVLAAAGIVSLGLMVVVNFTIRSDFRWALLGLAVLWTSGILLAAAAL